MCVCVCVCVCIYVYIYIMQVGLNILNAQGALPQVRSRIHTSTSLQRLGIVAIDHCKQLGILT